MSKLGRTVRQFSIVCGEDTAAAVTAASRELDKHVWIYLLLDDNDYIIVTTTTYCDHNN